MVDRLAGRLAAHFGNRVRVTRPQKYGEVRVKGLVTSIVREDFISSLATGGACRQEEIKMGAFCFFPANVGTAWERMPLVAARRVVRAGMVRLG